MFSLKFVKFMNHHLKLPILSSVDVKMKVKREIMKYIFIGKFIRFGSIYLGLFDLFTSL